MHSGRRTSRGGKATGRRRCRCGYEPVVITARDNRFVLYTSGCVHNVVIGEPDHTTFLASSRPETSVSNITFPDQELDSDSGGMLSWGSTEESSDATCYEVYLAGNTNGASRSILGRANSTADSPSVAVETSLSPLFVLTIDTASSLVEQTTPGGASRSILGRANSTADSLSVAVETTLSPFVLTIYTASALVEQTTPGGHRISDASASVSDVFFTDQDLDLGRLVEPLRGHSCRSAPPQGFSRTECTGRQTP